MPPARAEAGPVASLPVARKRGCLPFQRPGCRARLLGRPGALQRLPLRLRLVTAYPQGCCDPWGPRSCAACATASGGGVARPRSPEPGRRRSPRRCADPGRGGRARRATPTRPCRPESAAWCGGWSWDASPRSWFGFQRQRYARTRPSGPHPQCVGGTGRVPLEESRSQRRWRSSSLPVPLPRRSWHGLAAALPWTPGDLGRALVVPPLRVLGERLLSLGRQRTRVLLGGIGALVLTRSCGPCGSPGRLAVAWCAWSSGGHRVLLVA